MYFFMLWIFQHLILSLEVDMHPYIITRHLHIDHLKGPCFNWALEWKAFMTTLLTLISDLEI